MPNLDGDGNAVIGGGSSGSSGTTGSLSINTSKQKSGKGTITPQYIVIHNTAGGTASSNADWFVGGAGGSGNCTQFITDDKEIYQIMPPTQKAQHIQGSNTSGGKGCASWAGSNAPALSQCGATNSNSIGIEVADGYNPNTNTYDESKVNMKAAVEMTIELTRYLMQQYNIPIENVVRHGDTHNKDCPMRIMQLGLWPYFKEQCVKRNSENKPVSFNPSTLDTSGQPSGGGGSGGYQTTLVSTGGGYTLLDTPLYATPTDIEVQLPDVDHRENTTNMDEVKGVVLIYHPPYNTCETDQMLNRFQEYQWGANYHYVIGKPGVIVSAPEGGDEETEEGEDGSGDGTLDGLEPAMIIPKTPENPEPEEPKDEEENPEVDAPETPTEIPEGDPVGGDKDLGSAGGFKITSQIDELKQAKGCSDNDTHTYIDRALFKCKKEKHCLMVALQCPDDCDDYPAYERALIEGISIILHEHGLTVNDLWREFDLNRAPSPFLYLDTGLKEYINPDTGEKERTRYIWQEFLTEVEKQLNWRNAKFGTYTKEYYKYTAGSSGSSGGSTGSINTTIGSGISPSTPTTGTTPSIGDISDNAQAVWTFFTGAGFSKECTAGIMGNLQQESGLDPTRYQSGGGKGRGIAQWSVGESRHNGLISYAKSKGKDWTDLQCQLEWIIKELQENWIKKVIVQKAGSYEAWQTMTDINKACDIFEAAFERAGIPAMEKRYAYAKQFYDKFSVGSVIPGLPDDEIEAASLDDLEPMTFVTPRTGEIFGWPLPGISKVSSKFGPRTPPCPGASSYHGGIDIGAASGTPILAYAAGTVAQNVSWHKSAGNYIKIDHGNGVATRYLHMVQPSPLAVGTQVQAGQEVGKVGNTGVGTGAHLHFEIHINGEKDDPLKYVNPGGGTKDTPTINPGATTPSNGVIQLGTGGSGGTTLGGDTSNLLYDDKKMEATNAPTEGNSAGGQNHDDWGGKTIYKKGEPSDASAEQPEIQNIISQEIFEDIMEYADPALIDDYTADFEPYSKGLASVDDNIISTDDRITAMTKQFVTSNENTFHYKVIESGPGSKDHCVTIAEELNYLAVPQDLKVEPIYPDLVIPPGYISTDADEASPNSIPIAVIEEGGSTSSDSYTKQLSFDYDLLEEKKKVSNKTHHPVNYTDPYPYDEKITDLEKHYPKVFIDEIEGQLYSCNHPGCPISQPMAKNFAMVSDAMMNQSKRIEKRLSRIENILSTIIRNQGRLGARMNINCVYYGGHSTFNKYKCIRCLHDDRVHDGQLVTVDQCLNCTRFEPILGQVYRILDDSGLNGSIVLDDMQMSYTDLEGFRNLNDITHRSSRYYDALATVEENCVKPTNTLEEIYKTADKDQAIAQIRKEYSNAEEAQKKIDELKEEDYIFKMDWQETFFNSQEPDTKLYPNEGIVARQKADVEGDGPNTIEDTIAELDPVRDAEVIEELKELIKIRDNIWVDTRDPADAVQVNKYSSENFFFEDFNKVRIGKYGIKFSSLYNYNGEDYNTIYNGAMAGAGGSAGGITQLGSGGSGSVFASQVRDKIVEMAKQILQDCNDGKAWYSQEYRTTEYTKPNTIKAGNGTGKIGYDCTSLVSCCYMHAGLKSMYAKSCSGGTLIREIQNGGKMIPCNKDNMQYILPGDIMITASSTITQNDCNQLKFFTSSHAAIYIGNNQIIHARGKNYGIQVTDINTNYYMSGKHVFVRPADLLAADTEAAKNPSNSGSGGQVDETAGTINNMSYVAKIPSAVVTAYSGDGTGANGPLTYNAHCASHNMPYGTKIYIPGLAGKAGDGIFTVQDTGGCFFDFDIYTTTWSGKTNMDAYVLQWGSGKISNSYTWAINLYNSRGTWSKYIPAWNTYKNMGGKLMTFTKFNQEDATITSHKNYND